MAKKPLYKIILCDYINPLSDKSCQYQTNGALVLRRFLDGYRFEAIGDASRLLKKYEKRPSVKVYDYQQFLALPAFFDLHFHWVQDEVCHKPKANLLRWLEKYTWPYEAKFRKKGFSKKKAREFKRKLLQVGTLGGACYASIHPHSVEDALDTFVGEFVVGNVLMTMNSPKELLQDSKQAYRDVSTLARKFKRHYAFTPRFAPTTDPELMKKGAKLVRSQGGFIQTHLSETKNEINYVLDIYREIPGFENVKSYTEVYKRSSLLGRKTIMGHGIYLSPKELELLAKSKTAIAHCPTSNAPVKELGLGSGLFDFRKVEKKGIPWALGSDIGAGPYLSMIDVMNSFVLQNRRKKIKTATFVKALYRTTLASAKILGIAKTHGNMKKGKWANLVFVPNHYEKNAEKALEKSFLSKKRSACMNTVKQTFYRGEKVY